MDIGDCRKRIDDIDEELVRLLNDRARYAVEIGHLKRIRGQSVYQPERERAVLSRAQELNRGPLTDAQIKRLFERIVDEARTLESEAGTEDES